MPRFAAAYAKIEKGEFFFVKDFVLKRKIAQKVAA